jgi:actin-related protein
VQHFHRTRMLDDCKESVVAVSESPFSPAELAMRPPRYYEFPTGYNKNFVLERFRVGELLFAPQKYAWKTQDSQTPFIGLAEMVAKSLAACDVDMRSTLVGNIIVTGGGSLLTGLADRINLEFARFASYGRVRVHFGASNEQRKFGAWIGGSILGSLAATQQLWMTRKEFEENGPAAIERKFP